MTHVLIHRSLPVRHRSILRLFCDRERTENGTNQRVDRAHDRVTHVVNSLLERAHKHTRIEDAEHHVFCSEWAGIVFKRLGLAEPEFDPRMAAPVTALIKSNLFAEPVQLVPEEEPAKKS